MKGDTRSLDNGSHSLELLRLRVQEPGCKAWAWGVRLATGGVPGTLEPLPPLRIYRDYIGYMLGLYWDKGK